MKEGSSMENEKLPLAREWLQIAAAERVYRFVLAKHPELDPEKTA